MQENCRKGPKDTDNDATPDLYAMDELKPEEKKDIAKIQKYFYGQLSLT